MLELRILVDNIDYDGDGKPDEYGTARIPASYNAAYVLPPEAAGGKTNVPMFENDNSGNRCLVIANRNLAESTKIKGFDRFAAPLSASGRMQWDRAARFLDGGRQAASQPDSHVDLPTNYSEAAAVLGRPGLRALATV